MTVALTTKLEAVNTMLEVIGESPVASLGGTLPVSASTAESVLDEVNREVQSSGWHFNTEHEYDLTRAGDDTITLASNVSKVDTAQGKHTDIDGVQRGSVLYDRKNHVNTFSSDLEVSISFLLEFTEIPEQFRNYITIKAARIFANRFLGSGEIERFTLRDEIGAKAVAIDADSEAADRSIFDNYDVLRVIDR